MTTTTRTTPAKKKTPSPKAVTKKPRGDSRTRMIGATAELLQKQGYAGTGLAEILATSGAPRGSLYFHFPGGKEQLACEALAASGREWITRFTDITNAAKTPADALDGACAMLGDELERSGWEIGCPIATVALEAAHTSEAIQQTCAAHFAELEALVTSQLERAGVPAAVAPVAATFAISAVEGSLLLARAYRSRAPLERVAMALRAQMSAMIAG